MAGAAPAAAELPWNYLDVQMAKLHGAFSHLACQRQEL